MDILISSHARTPRQARVMQLSACVAQSERRLLFHCFAINSVLFVCNSITGGFCAVRFVFRKSRKHDLKMRLFRPILKDFLNLKSRGKYIR